MVNPYIFREYDIRGVAEQDFPDDVTYTLGKTFGTNFLRNNIQKIVIGRDCRLSSPRLYQALSHGILDTGCHVVDLGIIPTPLLYFALFNMEVGGGVMIAPMLLQIRALREAGNQIVAVAGARMKDLLFFEDDMKALSNEFYVATDDGSEGCKGLDFLKEVLQKNKFDRCVAMGPVVMMKTVCELTKPFAVPTIVTLTPIMVDGMGMCGVCRVTVNGKMKFGCVDGPEFDGHQVDFEGLIKRQRMFLPEERLSSLLWELGGCRCGGK